MACGVPVITYKNALTIELLIGQALLTGPEIKDLVQALTTIKENTSVANEFAETGYEHVCDNFTEKEMSINYQLFYKEIYDQYVKE